MKALKLSISAVVVALMLAVGMPTQASAQQQRVEQITVGNLIAALNNINDVRALNNLTIENVRVVNVENVLNNNNVQAFNNALNNNNVAIGQVVAIDVLSGGDVILFFQQQ